MPGDVSKLLFSELATRPIEKLIISSLEQALYQAIVVIDGREHLVWENDKRTVKTRNLTLMRERFEGLNIAETVLRHESPYDEMIGQAQRDQSNRMEVPLGQSVYAPSGD